MILWTIQPLAVYNLLQTTGVYRCDPSLAFMRDYPLQYRWLCDQMSKRIGPPPGGVIYPIWAWYQWEPKRKRPDLRNERWGNGIRGDRFVRMEIDVPDDEVLLSDFDSWSIILLNGLISATEAEYDRLQAVCDALPTEEDQWAMRSRNWERVFDLSPLDDEWCTRGNCIQATFWELRKEQVKRVTHFVSAVDPKRFSSP